MLRIGLLDDTVFVLSSDHGDMQMQHQQFYKMVAYEASSHVPLVIAPGKNVGSMPCVPGRLPLYSTCIASHNSISFLVVSVFVWNFVSVRECLGSFSDRLKKCNFEANFYYLTGGCTIISLGSCLDRFVMSGFTGVSRSHKRCRYRGRVHHLTSTVDIFPTLVEIAGGIPAASLDGRSLLPFLEKGVSPKQATTIVSQFHGENLAMSWQVCPCPCARLSVRPCARVPTILPSWFPMCVVLFI
jgi:hypothetical protein